jgi:hypothetical protein
MEAQTLVTCLYDLARRSPGGQRPIELYLRYGELVLDLRQPLVAFVDPELVDRVSEARRERGLADRTRVLARPLEELPLFPVSRLAAGFPTIANGSPKDSPLHQVVEWSKLDLLDEAMATDPFGTEHFAWIDFGLGHVARAPESFPAPTRRVAMLQMRAVAPSEIADRLEFLRFERGRVAAGFFRGDRDHLERLIDLFRAELVAVLDAGFRPNEQSLLAYLAARRPELFEFYYGDYASILRNWDRVRGDIDTVFLNLEHCRSHGLWRQAHAVAENALSSVAAGELVLDQERLRRLLDEAFVAAGRVGRRDLAARWRDEQLLNREDSA